MEKEPVAKITVKALCASAGINRSTFYKHYTGIEELLRQIEDDTLNWARNTILSINRQADRDAIAEIVESTCKHIAEDSQYLRVLMTTNADANFQQTLMSLIYEQATFHGLIDTPTKELRMRFAVSGSIGLIQHWMENGEGIPPKTISNIIMSMVVNM
ncbi:MAG: TetR/AcrR family transcriptional regulator [Bifidobacterium psychraerophilum]|uniref:TetR/AcrR family transcriptional regulator n=1 Tax=Bifidobacterium psychraerophilum TaxID=218140 RepID=UPI0039E8EF38